MSLTATDGSHALDTNGWQTVRHPRIDFLFEDGPVITVTAYDQPSTNGKRDVHTFTDALDALETFADWCSRHLPDAAEKLEAVFETTEKAWNVLNKRPKPQLG